jgi:hypothetical protein
LLFKVLHLVDIVAEGFCVVEVLDELHCFLGGLSGSVRPSLGSRGRAIKEEDDREK